MPVLEYANEEDKEGYQGRTNDTAEISEAVCLCLVIIVAVAGNISVWIIICKSRDLRTVTNMFILVLSAADFLVSVVNMPLTVYAVAAGGWPFSETYCTVFGFINMLFLVTSVLSLCNISINRYVKVCRCNKFKAIYTKRNATFMIIGVVTLSVLLSLPPLFGWGKYSYISVQSFCFCDWTNSLSYAIFMIICCFGGPFSVMTVCNIFIYRTVRASRKRVSKSTCYAIELAKIASSPVEDIEIKMSRNRTSEPILKQMSFSEKLAEKKEHKMAMSLIVVVITFVICWLPYCFSMLVLIFYPNGIGRGFHVFTITLGYANSCCNPIIYGLMNSQFRKGFRDLYCWCRNV